MVTRTFTRAFTVLELDVEVADRPDTTEIHNRNTVHQNSRFRSHAHTGHKSNRALLAKEYDELALLVVLNGRPGHVATNTERVKIIPSKEIDRTALLANGRLEDVLAIQGVHFRRANATGGD